MKPYGIPKLRGMESPDNMDIFLYGLASHVGNVPGKGGDFRATVKSSVKAKARRLWKKRERARALQIVRRMLKEWFEDRRIEEMWWTE